jgi:hypothetical protein
MTPVGNPVAVIESVGVPVVVTVKEPTVPAVKVVDPLLLNAGAALMVRVNDWVAGVPAPFVAVISKV